VPAGLAEAAFSHKALLQTRGKDGSDHRAKIVCFPSGQPSMAGG